MSERIASAEIRSKVMSAEEAAQFVNNGDTVGMSGFTGAAYPKALPTAIATPCPSGPVVTSTPGSSKFSG